MAFSVLGDGVTVRMSGFEQVSRRLEALPGKVRGRIARKAIGAAALVIRREARKNALNVDDPETGRRIADNIGQRMRTRHNRMTGEVRVSVGVLSEHGRIPSGNPDTGPRGNTPHWHLIELGTDKMRAQPFLRTALAQNIDAAINRFAVVFTRELNKEA